jgi:hypothetical protein
MNNIASIHTTTNVSIFFDIDGLVHHEFVVTERSAKRRFMNNITSIHTTTNTPFYLTSTVWCTMSSCWLNGVLLVISTRKFCRGCAMQFDLTWPYSCSLMYTVVYSSVLDRCSHAACLSVTQPVGSLTTNAVCVHCPIRIQGLEVHNIRREFSVFRVKQVPARSHQFPRSEYATPLLREPWLRTACSSYVLFSGGSCHSQTHRSHSNKIPLEKHRQNLEISNYRGLWQTRWRDIGALIFLRIETICGL